MTRRGSPASGRACLLLAALVLASSVAAARARAADDEPAIPAPVGFVNDHAGVFRDDDRARLEAFLDQVRRKTGAEFAVLVVRSTEPLDPSTYKVRVFEQWKLGRKGLDNGLLLLVALDQHEARFETGYGLEGTLPDGLQSRIFRGIMRPRFRAGDIAGGITQGVLATAAVIAREKGVTLEWNGRELRYAPRSRGLPPWLGLVVVGLFALAVMANLRGGGGGPFRGRRIGRALWIGGMGGLGGWGGGFGGGFGGSGGGFGGFGGGASGGGGGGGSW